MRPKATPDPEIPECAAQVHRTPWARHKRGCICPSGKTAATQYRKQWLAGVNPPHMIDGQGTRRRMQGLAARGFTSARIGTEIGRSKRRTFELYTAGQVTTEVAGLVAEATIRLAALPTPEGRDANYVRNYASKQGWWPLDAWYDIDTDPDPSTVDEITVMHAVAGFFRWGQLTDHDRQLVVAELSGRRWSDVRIAEHLGTSHSRVARVRSQLGIPATPSSTRRTA